MEQSHTEYQYTKLKENPLPNSNLPVGEGFLKVSPDNYTKGLHLVAGVNYEGDFGRQPGRDRLEILDNENKEIDAIVDIDISLNETGQLVFTNKHPKPVTVWIYGQEVIARAGEPIIVPERPPEYKNNPDVTENALYFCVGNKRAVKVSKSSLDQEIKIKNFGLNIRNSGLVAEKDTISEISPKEAYRYLSWNTTDVKQNAIGEPIYGLDYISDADTAQKELFGQIKVGKNGEVTLSPREGAEVLVRHEDGLPKPAENNHRLLPNTYFRYRDKVYYYLGLGTYGPRVVLVGY